MALHGEIKVNGEVIGWWDAQRIETTDHGRHLYRWEAVERARIATGSLWHSYDYGAMSLAAKVLTAAHKALSKPRREGPRS